jgi:PHD/YefM family antitoxin component YafN of YafNO toxin-antitoxin module
MISLSNIHSFTDFQRNAKGYASQIRDRKEPIVLTINGEAALVVHEATTFQAMISHVEELEEELRQAKLELLRQEVELGVRQIQEGNVIPAGEVFARLRDRSQALRDSEQ